MHVSPDELFTKSLPETEQLYLGEMFERFPTFIAETMINYGVKLKIGRPNQL